MACPVVAAAALLGVTFDGEVWRIDESTGALERTGATGHGGENALAVDASGTVYAVAGVPFQGVFLETIDPLTGAGTLGAKLDPPLNPRGMAFSPGGALYATDAGVSSGDSGRLFRIDVVTGLVTTIGLLGEDTIQALDFGPDGKLYGMVRNDLGTIDLATGRFSLLASFPDAGNVQSFVFLPSGRIVGGGTTLYELDPATGTSRQIAPLGRDFGGFAFLPGLPEPPPATPQAATTTWPVAAFAGPLRGRIVTLGSVAYFEIYDSTNGVELWKSDGTLAGTQLVKLLDPDPSCCSSVLYEGYPIVNMAGTLFFQAFSPATGRELWKSDGTDAGSQLVADIAPGTADSHADPLTPCNGTLYFVASDGSSSADLYWTDGTPAGTQGGIFAPSDPTCAGGLLFFNRPLPPFYDPELWRTDGTPAGTQFLGAPGSELTNVGGTLFFTRTRLGNQSFIDELWKSDGTTGGTVLVKQIDPEVPVSSPHFGPADLTDVNGTLFFSAQNTTNDAALWKSDGTPAGTLRLTDIASGVSNPRFLTNVDGTLFFSAQDGPHGRELWKSDGTVAGTRLVADIQPGVRGSDPSSLADAGGMLIFTACDDVAGCEPWVTTPSYPGALRFADLVPGPAFSRATDFTRVGDLVLFRVAPVGFGTAWELRAVPVSLLSLECSDGIDNDGDGLVDFDGGAFANGGVPVGARDPGCLDGAIPSREAPPCQDGIDDDGDGGIDFDGGAIAHHGVPLAAADLDCTGPAQNTELPWQCGLGGEAAVVLPLVAALRRWRRRERFPLPALAESC